MQPARIRQQIRWRFIALRSALPPIEAKIGQSICFDVAPATCDGSPPRGAHIRNLPVGLSLSRLVPTSSAGGEYGRRADQETVSGNFGSGCRWFLRDGTKS